jgi:hypothetical protein
MRNQMRVFLAMLVTLILIAAVLLAVMVAEPVDANRSYQQTIDAIYTLNWNLINPTGPTLTAVWLSATARSSNP